MLLLLVIPCVLRLKLYWKGDELRFCLKLRLLWLWVRLFDRRLWGVNQRQEVVHSQEKHGRREKKAEHKGGGKSANGRRVVKILLEHLHLRNLWLDLRLGTGDAAEAALLCGLLQSLIYSLLPYVHHRLGSLELPPELRFSPCFNERCFDFELGCIAVVTLGNIIYRIAAWRLMQKKPL